MATFTGQAGITTTKRSFASCTSGIVPWAQRRYHLTMIIPQSALSSEALIGIIKEFVTREGTEYGTVDISLETKVKQVQRQLERGDLVIVFDEGTESVDLVSKGSQRYKTLLAQSAGQGE